MPSMSLDDALLTRLAERAETLLARIESLLPQTPEPDWDSAVAFRWRRRHSALGAQSWLAPVRHRGTISLDDLYNIDEAKRLTVAWMPYKLRTHLAATALVQPWLVGYRRPLFWNNWFESVDIEPQRRPDPA
jgi:predicted AAA+ superfamily ATPase